MDDVADVDLAEADHAVNWCGDCRIIELRLRRLDGRLIGIDGRFGHIDLGLLQVDVLLGLVALLRERLKSRQVLLIVDQLRFVLALSGDGLVERGFQRRRINLGEDVALPDFLALAEINRDDLAVDLRTNSNRVEGLNRAKGVRIDPDVAHRCFGDSHRHRWPGGGRRGLRAGVPPKHDARYQGRQRNPCDNQKNLTGIPPDYPQHHGRSYSLLSLLLKTAFLSDFRALLADARRGDRYYTGLGMSDALNLIKIAPPSH